MNLVFPPPRFDSEGFPISATASIHQTTFKSHGLPVNLNLASLALAAVDAANGREPEYAPNPDHIPATATTLSGLPPGLT